MANKKIVYVDMDGVLVNVKAAIIKKYDYIGLNNIGEILDTDGSIFRDAPPMPGAIESFNQLSEDFDVYILSTAPWSNPEAWMFKRLWVEQHLGQKAFKRLILSHNKHLCAGDFLIDDRTKNGADKFNGELIQFGNEEFPTWPIVLSYLRANK